MGAGGAIGVPAWVVDRGLFGPPTAEVLDIGVVSACRRQGHGTRLLQFAVNASKRAGASALFARTYAASRGAIALSERNGFARVAVIPVTNGPDDEGDLVLRHDLRG